MLIFLQKEAWMYCRFGERTSGCNRQRFWTSWHVLQKSFVLSKILTLYSISAPLTAGQASSDCRTKHCISRIAEVSYIVSCPVGAVDKNRVRCASWMTTVRQNWIKTERNEIWLVNRILYLSSTCRSVLAFFQECRSLISYATHCLFCYR